MDIINIPLGSGASVDVSEANDVLTITVDATILKTPEQVQLNFSLPQLLGMIASEIANPILAIGFKWLASLL